MADIEKVIKGLENLREAIATDYIREADQAVGTIADALELLKERKMGKYVSCKVKTSTGKWNGEKCSVCGSQYIGSAPHKWNYCPDCGAKMERPVKWDG